MPQSLGITSEATIKNYKEVFTSPSISSNTLTLDLSLGNVFNVSLNANITTMTISNVPSTTHNVNLTIVFTADGTTRSVTWPNSVVWPSGTAPGITSTNGKIDVYTFTTNNGGTTWFGFIGGQNY